MGRITTGIGLMSGMDIASIVDQLMTLEARPRDVLTERQSLVDAQRLAVMSISTQLSLLRSTVTNLRTGNAFASASAIGSNDSILRPYASNGAIAGSYQFTVARMASSQQLLASGMADATSTAVGAGTVTFQSAAARLDDDMNLELLNGQQGVSRGSIRITDRSGASAVIDLSTAVTINDVLEAINTSEDVDVQAATDNGKIVLTDLTGQSASNLIVAEINQGSTAADLGILDSVASATLTGSDLVSVNADTALSLLNNNMGVGIALGEDIHFALQDGTEFDVDVFGLDTLGEVVSAINNDSGNPGDLVAAINSAGDGIELTDVSVGGGTLTVTSVNDSTAAHDLGILGSDGDSDGVITGSALLGGLNEVLLSRLIGGSGVDRGSISITDREGVNSVVDLSGSNTIQDVIAAINDGGVSADVTASINSSGNGIVITDNTSGGNNLIIADQGGTTMAADLGITVDAAVSQVASGDLDRQFISQNTRLASLNRGQGISRGTFEITDSNGVSATVDLTQGNEVTLWDVINEINSKPTDITARINDTGDGLILEDTGEGEELLTVEDVSGASAADLGIAGTAAEATTFIDGSSEVSITVGATDTLQDVVDAINNADVAVQAGILNDGSPINPYRLSLVSSSSGTAGAMLVDTGAIGMTFSEVIRGTDAVLRVGDGATGDPLLITSSSNSVTSVIDKVTLDLISADPTENVTVTVSPNVTATISMLKGLIDGFNSVIAKVNELTAFNIETMTGGTLQGDTGIINAQRRLYSFIFQKFSETDSRYETLSAIGFRLGSGRELSLDEGYFEEVFTEHPEDVEALLADLENGALTAMSDMLSSLSDPATGALTIQADRLQSQSELLQDRIDSMNVLLSAKRERLTANFIAMERALATLQGQQSAVINLAAAVDSWQQTITNRSSGSW